ncbi:MAG TPA: hypothetical protein VHR72_07420 [Gemmataceae bacterium]|jgi:hypothetical protein|nr:hypothetical protein [Gemmataceae bacterium]
MTRPRLVAGLLLTLALGTLALPLVAQDAEVRQLDRRYNIEYNPVGYPQKTPQEGLKAIVRALDAGAYEYMLAHLVDPKFVDTRVAEYFTTMFPKELLRKEDEEIALAEDALTRKRLEIGKERRLFDRRVLSFVRLVKETRKHFSEDPVLLRELRQMARDGEWDADDTKGTCSLKAVTTRKAFFKAQEGRWFMEERQK